MKRALFFSIVAALAVLFVSCSKESNEVQTFKATAEQAAGDSKISLSGLSLLWSAGDQISIYDNASNSGVYTLSSGAGTGSGTFALSSGSSVSATPYSAVYPANIRTGATTVSLPAVQHSTNGGLQELPMYAVGDDMELKFHHLCGVVRFRLSASSAVSLSRIAVATDRNTNGAATISGSGSSVTLSTPSGSNVTTLSCEYGQSIASGHDFYMYMPAGTYSTFRILFTAADGSICSKSANTGITVERGKITTITLSGLTFTAHRFTVNNSSTVVFSPGNLQYIGSAASPYWKFADRQTDYFGRNEQHGSTATNVDRDLFGWGTSGWNNGNMRYQPYNTDYPGNSSNGYGYGPTDGSSYTYNLTGTYANADWGVYNAIRNGGNVAGQWRTLSQGAWDTLLNNRPATVHYAKAQLGGNINGVLLFPDDYVHPDGVGALSSVDTYNANFTTNSYSLSDWFKLEAAGVVFLPAAGNRGGMSVNTVGSYGFYWSSSYYSSYGAWNVNFDSGNLNMGSNNCYNGFSVRLVRG